MDVLSLVNFKPTTAGEILFQGLIRAMSDEFERGRIVDLPLASIPGRPAFGHYLEDGVLIYTYKRILKLAAACLKNADVQKGSESLVNALASRFDWLRGDRRNLIFRLARNAHLQSHKRISQSVKREVWQECADPACYFCGRPCDPVGRARDFKFVIRDTDLKCNIEHVWPASLGGESIFENLVPACMKCNEAKADIFSWAHRPGHEMVYAPGFQTSSHFKSIEIRDRIVVQRRAVLQYAAREKITLKESMKCVGPYGKFTISDPDDTWDFFNMHNHQESLGEVLW